MTKTLNILLIYMLFLGFLSLSGCGEPLSDHEKEIKRIEKEIRSAKKQTARLNKKLDGNKKRRPELFIDDGSFEKRQIDQALKTRNWNKVKSLYKSLLDKDIELNDYSTQLEARVKEIVSPLPADLHIQNYLGYDLLQTINPENEAYNNKADTYKLRAIEHAKGKRAKLKRNFDKVEGIEWFHHRNQPQTGAFFYIGQKPAGKPWIRLRAEYFSKFGWLFVNQVVAWYDGEKTTLLSGPFDRRNTRYIWEWQDISPSKSQIKIMRSLANADESLIRFIGKDKHYDAELSSRDKQVILDVLDAYDAMISLHEHGLDGEN